MTHHPEGLMSHVQHSVIKKLPLQLLEIVSFGLLSFWGFQTCMWISCSVNKPSQISCNGAAEPLQRSDGVVVITSALHAEGREFDPRSDLVRFKSIISLCLLSNWSQGQKTSHDARRLSSHAKCGIHVAQVLISTLPFSNVFMPCSNINWWLKRISCISRESNPDRPLGRRPCWPLHHWCFTICVYDGNIFEA